MINLQYFVLIGALVNILGAISYIKKTLSGHTKPNRVTWFLWSVSPFIATAAALTKGITWAALPVFMAGFGPFLIFLASFANKKSYWKLGKFDYLCGFFSILALTLWGITKEPIVAIVFAILSDALAAIPTLKKSWTHPKTESPIAYTTGMFNAITSFAAIKTWTFAEYGFPVYIIIICGLLLSFIYRLKIKNLFKR